MRLKSLVYILFALNISLVCYAAEYLLGSGDVINITVWGYEQLSGDYKVLPDGKIYHQLLGDIEVQGLSLKKLKEVLTESFAEYIKKPVVFVTLKELRGLRVYVLGEGVAKPSAYQLTAGSNLLDAIAVAGGLLPYADLQNVIVRREGASQELRINLEEVIQKGELSKNIMLLPDDVVMVPKKEAEVLILGLVAKPGRYLIERPRFTLVDALNLSGGLAFPEGTIAGARAIVIRAQAKPTIIDLERLLLRGDLSQNVNLLPEDIVLFTLPTNEIYVLGKVNKPGSYKLQEGAKILDAISSAGGVVEEKEGIATSVAELENVQIIRAGMDKPLVVNLDRLLTKGDIKENVELEAGDIIIIPERAQRVYIIGEVKNPGSYPLTTTKATIIDIISSAGGITDNADLSKALLRRASGEEIPVDLYKLLKQADMSQNLRLQPGDIILLPTNLRKVYIFGEVAKPGAYTLEQEDKVLDVLSQANPTKDAALDKVGIVRLIVGEKPKVVPVNFGKLLKGDRSQNITITDGDVIFVPHKKKKIEWGQVVSVIYSLELLTRIAPRLRD